MSLFMRIAAVVVTLLYPLGVYFGLQYFNPRSLVILLVAVLAVRFFTVQKTPANHWVWLVLVGLLALWAWVANTDTALKFYPVLVNLSFLIMFAWSLKHPPCMIERFARIKLSDAEIDLHAQQYMRKVTMVWCVFFIVNGSISLVTCLWGSDEVWALYNGLIAYILLGAMFAIEWLVRQQVMKKHHE